MREILQTGKYFLLMGLRDSQDTVCRVITEGGNKECFMEGRILNWFSYVHVDNHKKKSYCYCLEISGQKRLGHLWMTYTVMKDQSVSISDILQTAANTHPASYSLSFSVGWRGKRRMLKEEIVHCFLLSGTCPATSLKAGLQHTYQLLGKTNSCNNECLSLSSFFPLAFIDEHNFIWMA